MNNAAVVLCGGPGRGEWRGYEAVSTRSSIHLYAKKLPAIASEFLSAEEVNVLVAALESVSDETPLHGVEKYFDGGEVEWDNKFWREEYAHRLQQTAGICIGLSNLLKAM